MGSGGTLRVLLCLSWRLSLRGHRRYAAASQLDFGRFMRPSRELSSRSQTLSRTVSTIGAPPFRVGAIDLLPRQRNLWVTDAFEWRPEVGLARPPNAG